MLLVDSHHIIMDGMSLNNLIIEFNRLYNGADLKRLPIQYRDYTMWENNYNKSNEVKLDKLTIEECEKYISLNEFAKGSMLPKIEACMDFVKNSNKGIAIITSLDKAIDAINGLTGTIIQK